MGDTTANTCECIMVLAMAIFNYLNISCKQQTNNQELTNGGHNGKHPKVHLGGGHGYIQQVVWHHWGEAQQQQQLPALPFYSCIQYVPLLPFCSDHGHHDIPQQIPAVVGWVIDDEAK